MGFKGDVVQLYPNIAENVYGYIVTLLDDTGAPLANKQVYCTTNAVTYNTNASGVITDVVYSTNASAIVTFELTNQPWADGTYRLNWTISGKTPGVIQSVSSTASKTYDGCAYTITFRNYDNNLWTNNSVYCTTNGKTYQTNASGQASFITSQSSLSFKITSGVQDTSVSGDFQMLNTYDIICSTTGTSGQLVNRTLTGSKSRVSQTAIGLGMNVPTSGDVMTIGTKEYIVTYDDGTNIYAVLRYWEENCVFDTDNRAFYEDSDIVTKCTTWYSNQVPATWKNLNAFNDVVTEGVTAPCFIPTIQALSRWTYFAVSSNRIFYDSSGTAHAWWTASYSSYNEVWCVSMTGSTTLTNPNLSVGFGFRPALAIKRSMFLNG